MAYFTEGGIIRAWIQPTDAQGRATTFVDATEVGEYVQLSHRHGVATSISAIADLWRRIQPAHPSGELFIVQGG